MCMPVIVVMVMVMVMVIMRMVVAMMVIMCVIVIMMVPVPMVVIMRMLMMVLMFMAVSVAMVVPMIMPVVMPASAAMLAQALVVELVRHLQPLLILLAPFAPHIAEELWHALGNTTSALHYLAVAVVLNIALDVLLLIIIPCGIAGAAAATIIAQYASALLALRKFFHLHGAWRFSLRRPFFAPHYLIPILSTSIPAGMQAVFMSISSLVIQTYINSFGYAAMAGMTVYARIEGFLYYPLFAFGIALTSFIGQNVGAHDLVRVREGLRLSLRIAAFGAMGMALAAGLAAPALIALFTDDPAVIENALDAVYYTFPFYWLYGINQIYIGALRGLGDTLYPMMTALAAYCVFRVAWCYAWDIVGIHSMHVVYNAYNVSFLVMGGLLYWGCRRALRRTNQMPTA